ncbi:MAG: lysylphosphatidylglycerol synthetase family protein [Phycisphaeraceae bacterium]|nr:lysylphosphatidylglycerol synthetase family protein [Phycisphaeraceae bacterium]MCB9847521.1 lysylphosphatidylglycerol synthetase family protein [Phycisphaeraceae bacterium]
MKTEDSNPQCVAPDPVGLAAIWRWGRRLLLIGAPALLLWLVRNELHALDIQRVRAVLDGADGRKLLAGCGAAFLALAVMGLYDAVAFPGGSSGRLGFWRRWSLGAVLFGWTNFIAMGPLGGPTLRLIAYRKYGLTATEITRGMVAHYLGSATGLAAWLLAVWLPIGVGVEAFLVRVAIAFGASLALPILAARALTPILKRRRFGAELDHLPLAPLGMVSFFDWGLTLASFWLLASSVGVGLDPTDAARTVYLGHFAGMLSMIPGGLGSADAVWFKGFALMGITHESAAAAIVAFRGGFYLTPWLASLIAIYVFVVSRSERMRLWQRRLVAGAVMLNAALLLISAATPALRDRLDAVARFVPLGAIEASHAVAVATAAIMLFLVRGLLRGYRSAYFMAMVMLAASALAHPLKGGDYEESVAALLLMALLFGVRKAFTRSGRTPIGWEVTLAAGLGALAIFLVSGFAAFEHIRYRQDLWTTFADRAEASRFLRGGVLLAAIVGAAFVRQAMRPVSLFIVPTAEDIARAEDFARRHADSADPLLVGGGDKGVWFHNDPARPDEPTAIFLFQRRGDRIIVFKNPVTAENTDPAPAIDAFLRYCEELDVEPIFSMISTEWMGRLHDFGFHFLKIAQEAVVPLDGWTLQGGRNAGFRRTIRDMEKAEIRFEVCNPPFDGATIDQLRAVSDAWLAAKGGRELQFSACCFSPAYLQRHPVCVARDASGSIVAFANLLLTRPGGPATLDFMRYRPGIIDNLMDFVIIRTLQTAAESGATSFSLGGAALSDVGVQRGSRVVERALHLFSTRAERLYNYRGLLLYKSKFHPAWEPRYLAYRQPWDWASALLANARLVEAGSRADRRRIAAARIGAGS